MLTILFISTLLEVLTKTVRNKIHKNWKGQNIPVIIYRRYYCLIGNPKELRWRIKLFKIESLALLSYTINIQISTAFSPISSGGTESACNAGDQGSSLGREDSLGKEMATHSSILAWRFPGTEEPGGLQSVGLPRVGHNWVTNCHCIFREQHQILLSLVSAWKWSPSSGSQTHFNSLEASHIVKSPSWQGAGEGEGGSLAFSKESF